MTEIGTEGSGSMTKSMGTDIRGTMHLAISIRAGFTITPHKALESSISRMETAMKAFGRIIKKMAMASTSRVMGKLLEAPGVKAAKLRLSDIF
mmetsp:Transcript_22261/g.10678  ORF Transcript_22261/g.10678 Transcript_22261/m.10678 type:complete len:93 (+) Transcript_22261:3-281(+)